MGDETTAQRLRREPPRFRMTATADKTMLTPRMVRVTFTGEDLRGLQITEPAASVRLLIPSPGSDELVIPDWNGNEFLLENGERPIIRTFTPRFWDPDTLELVLDIVLHEGGTTSRWASACEPGAEAAVSGPGRGYELDPAAARYVLAGDETAIPAICQLIEHIPTGTPVEAIIEVTTEQAILDLPHHENLDATWLPAGRGLAPGSAMVEAVIALEFSEHTKLWAAGEAAAVHKIRRALLGDRIDRRDATIRGYWKDS
jgi:NADPH-dependent ferric siderophore reductase